MKVPPVTKLRNPIDLPGKTRWQLEAGNQATLHEVSLSRVVSKIGLSAERTEAYPIAEVSNAEDNCLVVYRWNTGELFFMPAA